MQSSVHGIKKKLIDKKKKTIKCELWYKGDNAKFWTCKNDAKTNIE